MAEPPITVMAAHTSGPLAMPVTRIVIHATCPSVGFPAASAPGAAQGTAQYFAQAGSGGSAHYVEDPTTEAHCVPDNVTAWHAPPNGNSIGIEICAEGGDYALSYTRDQWLSPEVWPGVQRAAARASELCDRFGVPKVQIGTADLLNGARGICGHVDVSQAWHQSSHSDPGPAFPWAEFMAEVNGTPQEDDMTPEQATQLAELHWMISTDRPQIARLPGIQTNVDKLMWGVLDDTQGLRTAVAGLYSKLSQSTSGQITAADIAAIIPQGIAAEVVALLGQRLNTPATPKP
jgi:hypothetical protein